MSWFYLVLAGLLEIVWAIGLKYTEGFTKLVPSLITIVAMVASVWFLALALRTIPVGTGYASARWARRFWESCSSLSLQRPPRCSRSA